MRNVTRWMTPSRQRLLDRLSETSPTEYSSLMVSLGEELAKCIAPLADAGTDILLVCTNLDADSLARGLLGHMSLEGIPTRLACFWNERLPVGGTHEAVITRSYIEPGPKPDIIVMVSSVISSEAIVRANLEEVLVESLPRVVAIVTPILSATARHSLVDAFPSEVAQRLKFYSFAEDAEPFAEMDETEGLARRLGLSEPTRYVPEIVVERRRILTRNTTPAAKFAEGTRVRHRQHGIGTLQLCQDLLAIVEFDSGLQRVPLADLEALEGASQVKGRSTWDPAVTTILKLLAEAILSVNDSWGVFSPSNIDLLPHQLWVCKKVNTNWPTRWLVADDVGLGKTIEAGLILWPLISRGQAKRVLVLTPANLVEQWRDRLYGMFDLRLQIYRPEEDKAKSNFWERENQVIASFHTLRQDRNDRHQRLFEGGEWDLILVDEAHHLNSDEKLGPTKAYQLVHQLEMQGLVSSMIFFTATPHRGKDYGFFSLLQLLRSDLFNPRLPTGPQLPSLSSVVVRNNKYTVTDLAGQRLFQPPAVRQLQYSYTDAEQSFYDLISDFIRQGFAYSSRLPNKTMGNAVGLVLIAIQKLAASSVAAILRALRRRLAGHDARRRKRDAVERSLNSYKEATDTYDLDTVAALEEELAALSGELLLLEDEQPHLRELIQAAERVNEETKINLILELLSTEFAEEQVLIFTEYKATQSLLMSKLNAQFGDDSTVFINGDERAEEVRTARGESRTISMSRQQAADAFNTGRARYLVATEAGGEGIDLQERCSTLIHADMPWNPMRMQQRVGRLNRYGQKKRVDVLVMTNPDTVESRIHAKLSEKLEQISKAFQEVMEEPEDLFSLVLGMTNSDFFSELYGSARRSFSKLKDEDKFSLWFDQNTAKFAGADVVATVKGLVGNCSRFNFQRVSEDIPRVDILDLKPFFESILAVNHRRPTEAEDGTLAFVTPDDWKKEKAVSLRYSGLHFDRTSKKGREGILGVGHKAMLLALKQARAFEGTLTALRRGPTAGQLVVFRIRDGVTDSTTVVRYQLFGIHFSGAVPPKLLKDWQVIQLLNTLLPRSGSKPDEVTPAAPPELVEQRQQEAEHLMKRALVSLDLPFQVPLIEILGTIWG